jgi:hypothetical protein
VCSQANNGAIVYAEELLWNYSVGPDKPRHVDRVVDVPAADVQMQTFEKA